MSSSLNLDGFQCVVLGSYRKHWAQIKAVCELFRSVGIEVLYPPSADATVERQGFVFLTGQEGADPAMLQTQVIAFVAGMSAKGFVYVCDVDGYLGRTVCYELGRVHGRGTPFFFWENPKDPPELAWMRHEAAGIVSPSELVAAMLSENAVPDFRGVK